MDSKAKKIGKIYKKTKLNLKTYKKIKFQPR